MLNLWTLSIPGGEEAPLGWGGRELTLLCGFNQYTLLQNRDNSGLLGTPLYCSPKLGGRCSSWGGRPPPCPPCGATPEFLSLPLSTSQIPHPVSTIHHLEHEDYHPFVPHAQRAVALFPGPNIQQHGPIYLQDRVHPLDTPIYSNAIIIHV